MNKGLSVAALAVVSVVTLSACGADSGGDTVHYKSGKAGQVVDRDIENGHYELETKDVKGKKHEFNVTFSVYNDCHKYSYYPSCVKSANDHKTVTPQYKKKQEQKKAEQRKKDAQKNKTSKGKSKGFSFGGGSKTSKKR